MLDPDLVFLMDTLNHDNINARMVGGCIRNLYFEKNVYDIDIACSFTPNETIDICKTAGIKTIPTGIDHGTVTALVNQRKFEITTLRQDVSTDGRHAHVTFTDNWTQDAKRRDFTINALYADRDGSIYDPLGTGLYDLQNHIVRFIGNAEDRINEDYLRILRFFRFYADYHDNLPDQNALNACYALEHGLLKLSDVRIFDELFKLLESTHVHRAIQLMEKLSTLEIIEGSAPQLKELTTLQNILQKPSIIARYYISFKNKKFIKNKKIIKTINLLDEFIKSDNYHDINAALYHYDRDIVIQGLLILKAKGNTISDVMIANAINKKIPQFPLTATDIMTEFKVPEGPQVGQYLRMAEDIWIASGFTLHRNEILDRLKS